MKEITTLGIDLAKNIYQLHGVDRHGKSVLKKAISRAKLLETPANIPPCLVDIEACGGAHHWAREIGKLGHQVRIIAPQFVSPYRKSGKNDANDAEAICEAVARPNMRFVAIKATEQQAALVVHRAREAIKAERTALINQIRGLLQEFGIVLPPRRRNLFQATGGSIGGLGYASGSRGCLCRVAWASATAGGTAGGL